MNKPYPPFVIAIQSQVVFGHVGNSAALFPMQAAGLEVAAIPTVIFSNTPDYPTLRGSAIAPDLFADLLRGAFERDLPQRADFLLTGYIGSIEVARQVAEFVAQCKAANPSLTYICDPVMGDHGPGLYVPSEIADIMRDQLVPLADIATPNSFELSHLAGQPVQNTDELKQAVKSLQTKPHAQIITTGCKLNDTADGYIESVIIGPDNLTRHKTPYIPTALAGTGDLFAGLVTAGLGHGRPLPQAVDQAQALVSRALQHARHLGAREIVLSEPGFRKALLEM